MSPIQVARCESVQPLLRVPSWRELYRTAAAASCEPAIPAGAAAIRATTLLGHL